MEQKGWLGPHAAYTESVGCLVARDDRRVGFYTDFMFLSEPFPIQILGIRNEIVQTSPNPPRVVAN